VIRALCAKELDRLCTRTRIALTSDIRQRQDHYRSTLGEAVGIV
jgi:hypothetical protein